MLRYLVFAALTLPAMGQTASIRGYCEQGANKVATSGLQSSTTVQQSFPRCTVNVYLTGTLTHATIYDTSTNHSLANPFTAGADGYWIFWAATTGVYDVTMSGGTSPNVFPAPVTLAGITIGSGGGGGGGDCGPLSGQPTSTNCGNNNLTTPVDSDHLQAFGYNNLNDNEEDTNVIGIGNGNGNSQEANEVILIGDTNGAAIPFVFPTPSDIIGIGNNNIDTMGGSLQDLVCMGDQNCQNGAWVQQSVAIGNNNLVHNLGTSSSAANSLDTAVAIGLSNAGYINSGGSIVAIGQDSGSGTSPSGSTNVTEIVAIGDGNASNIASNVDDVVAIGGGAANTLPSGTFDIVAIGDGAFKQCIHLTGCSSIPNPVATNNVIAIGSPALSFNQGNDVIGIGHGALGGNVAGAGLGYYNQANFNIAIGSSALIGNTTGANNVAFGAYAGGNGYVAPVTFGNSNHTGSNNTWIGYDAGPNTTSQLSNTIALGYTAHNTLSNQTVIGNDSTTEAHVFGTFFTPASSSAACTVPEFADDANFHYVCVATNTWKRVALSTF